VEVDRDTALELLEHAKTIKAVVDKYIESFPIDDELKALAMKFPVKDTNSKPHC